MGMFDDIICKYPLPGNPGSDRRFQTKDLNRDMSEYTITEEGRLICDRWHYEDTPKEKLPYPDAPKGSLQSLCGFITRVVDEHAVDQNYHGYLNFYDGEWSNEEQRHLDWFEYEAKFTDGKIVEVKRIENDR